MSYEKFEAIQALISSGVFQACRASWYDANVSDTVVETSLSPFSSEEPSAGRKQSDASARKIKMGADSFFKIQLLAGSRTFNFIHIPSRYAWGCAGGCF
jgi:hypothetical protein